MFTDMVFVKGHGHGKSDLQCDEDYLEGRNQGIEGFS
jgi:hypothetical protein